MLRILPILSIQVRTMEDAWTFNLADTMIYFNLIMFSSTIHYINLTFILVGQVHFRRKLFYMKMMSALIDPDKKDEKFIYAHFLPTLDITSHTNIINWMTLRTACLDFGKKYSTRISIYCSVFIIFYGTFALIMSLSFFEIVSYSIPWNVYIIAYFDILIILSILFKMLKLGAKVNNYFAIHKGILLRHKRDLWKLHSNFSVLENKDNFKSNTLKVLRDHIKEK